MLPNRSCDDDHSCRYGGIASDDDAALFEGSLFGLHAEVDHFLLGEGGEERTLRDDLAEFYLLDADVVGTDAD